ncbi:Oidioi.mRNA.OKI2018_I69.XSR.g13600.t1.cds [Oikopleura dioica]|uniref:Oidioi.mRNA.OKI2018_I69.XSR.g13600.t1.cds n=1 Tax=Oikopleura dioica TaxID=34765 RepID=A0ABN7SC40_OIKDI|nr:Oidioi.mRNA.OKI2018_I69.XSR.g13600.t1.cds [Oikopleura dioica]
MKELVYHDIKVRFPYEPYPAQNDYMSKCIEALKSGCHAILESPTGTGKTLCLLASVLAYREHFFDEMKRAVQSGMPGAHMGHVPKSSTPLVLTLS